MGGSGWSIGPGISFCLNFLFDIPLWNMDGSQSDKLDKKV